MQFGMTTEIANAKLPSVLQGVNINEGGTVMTEQERIILIETEQRSKSNTHRIDTVEEDMREIKNEQKAIYKIATSVEVIAQRVSNIEDKVDDTNKKVDAQNKAWQETERRLNDTQNEPYKRTANNVNSIKVAIITAICSLLVSGIVGAIIAFAK